MENRTQFELMSAAFEQYVSQMPTLPTKLVDKGLMKPQRYVNRDTEQAYLIYKRAWGDALRENDINALNPVCVDAGGD